MLQKTSINSNLSERLCTEIGQLGETAEPLNKNIEVILSIKNYETQLLEETQHLTSINTKDKNQSKLSQRQLELNKNMRDQLKTKPSKTPSNSTQKCMLYPTNWLHTTRSIAR
ncbi:MAG: hypothetical protein ABI045_07435 [Flavobacteriales bacterium]